VSLHRQREALQGRDGHSGEMSLPAMKHIRLDRFNPRPDARGSFVCVVGQHGTPDEPNRGLRCVGGRYRRMLLVARLGGTRAVPPLPRERIIGRHLDGPPARPSVQETSSRVGPDRGAAGLGGEGCAFGACPSSRRLVPPAALHLDVQKVSPRCSASRLLLDYRE